MHTVPYIKRCKSAFCSRRGAVRGAETSPLDSWHIVMATMFPFRRTAERAHRSNNTVLFFLHVRVSNFPNDTHAHTHTHTHAHALSEIPTACKQWAHMTAGRTLQSSHDLDSAAPKARTGRVLVLIQRDRQRAGSSLRLIPLFPPAEHVPGLSLMLRTAICHKSLNPLRLAPFHPGVSPGVQARRGEARRARRSSSSDRPQVWMIFT